MAKNLAPRKPVPNANDFALSFGLTEAALDRGTAEAPKREIVMTALQEGHGNLRDRRWYTREAVAESSAVFMSRRKLFANHLKEGQASSDEDVRNWCATMKETWTEDVGGKLHRKVRLKIHEEWLWTRCQEAPEEIALSIEGAGAGSEGIVEGETYTLIKKILSLNATKFVTYPGNATMGADLVEEDAESTEEPSMNWKDLTEALLKENRSDLIAAIVAAAEAPLKAKLAEADAKLAEAAKTKPAAEAAYASLSEDVKALKTSFNATLDEMRAKLTESERKLDAAEVRERIASKKVLIEGKLAASKLSPEAKTPRFMERLNALSERKVTQDGKEVVLTVEAQVDAEIAEQLKLTTSSFGEIPRAGDVTPAPAGAALTEEEVQVDYNHRILKSGPSLAEFRAQKAAAAKK